MKKLVVALFLLPVFAFAQFHYTVTPDLPAKSIRVVIAVDSPGPNPAFKLPAWCPGWYVLTNSENKISDARATGPGGIELKVNHPDPHTWAVVNPARGKVTFSYRVLGDEGGLGTDRVHVDTRTTFVNSPAALLYLEGRLRERMTVDVKAPEGWDVATALTGEGKFSYSAKDYDELIDCPIQMGLFHRRSFTVGGIPFEVVYVPEGETVRPNLDVETERLKKVTEPVVALFGGASFKRYLFVVHLASGMFGGGLEHCSCTVLDVGNTSPLNLDDLAAHELFHAWNVKQIRAKNLGPFDYSKPCRTKTLWFLEGVTDYYGALMPYRAGLWNARRRLAGLAGEIGNLQASPTRLKKTLEETCWQTWEHGGFGYDDLSYYTKGHIVGLLLDTAIREATGSAKTLDDVMRLMYARYKMPNPGYEEDGVLKAINEVAGKDLTPLYRRMMQSTEELPYERLGALGLCLVEPNEEYETTDLTLEIDRVAKVTSEQEEKGLKEGDRLVSARRRSGGKMFSAEFERDGKKVRLVLPLRKTSSRGYRLEVDPFASPQARARLAKWLKR